MLYICILSNKFDLKQTIRVLHSIIVMLSVKLLHVLSVIILIVVYAEYQYADCCFDHCENTALYYQYHSNSECLNVMYFC